MRLNKEQLQRLYNVFDFEEYEEIVCADLVENELTIRYVDNIDGVVGNYKPMVETEQLNFILNGIELERE